MKEHLRRFVRAVLPAHLQQKWHFRLFPEEYCVIKKSDLSYAEDNVFTLNSPAFLKNQRFLRAYELGDAMGSWGGSSIRWRAFVACWAGQHAAQLAGDFVECGVNRGGMARAIIDYVQFQRLNRKFYLVDNFTGLVPEYLNEAERNKQLLERYAYYKDNSKAEVEKAFSAFPNVQVVEGNVPDILNDIPARQVAYLSLDMNCTMPEIEAAAFFWDRMTPGGVILLDDYAQVVHSEQQLAFDQFAEQRETTVLALPTGQGIILKTAPATTHPNA